MNMKGLPESVESKKARFTIGILLTVFWSILMALSYFSFPFVGNTTKAGNIIYGITVSIPFIVIMTVYLVKTRVDLKNR